MRYRVLFALSLFLHLLVHPMVHAADMQVFAPAHPSSVAKVALVSPATPECAVCHIAGHVQMGRSAAILFAGLDSNPTVAAFQQYSPAEAVESHLPPRAPPVA